MPNMPPEPACPAWAMDQVSVTRGGRTILEDVTWAASRSERWCILGPNGAGKTTLVRVLSGRLYPTHGTVDVLGMRLGRVDVRSQLWPRVSLASAALDMRFPPGHSVEGVVRSGKYGYLATWREEYTEDDRQRARELMHMLDIAHLADRSLRHVSSGERKRISLARALMGNPEVLILDEPTSGLDMGGREQLLAMLESLCQGASPVPLLVTHHVEEIPRGITHALLMRGGRVAASGPLSEMMTSENLSDVFGTKLAVYHEGGRYWARGSEPNHGRGKPA